jgi:hypothetical protein
MVEIAIFRRMGCPTIPKFTIAVQSGCKEIIIPKQVLIFSPSVHMNVSVF